jgi:hypothetical protein
MFILMFNTSYHATHTLHFIKFGPLRVMGLTIKICSRIACDVGLTTDSTNV